MSLLLNPKKYDQEWQQYTGGLAKVRFPDYRHHSSNCWTILAESVQISAQRHEVESRESIWKSGFNGHIPGVFRTARLLQFRIFKQLLNANNKEA